LMKGMHTTAAIALGIAISASFCKTSAVAVTTFPEATSYRALPGEALPVDAFGFVGGLIEARFYQPHPTTDDAREEIRQAASLYGIDLPMMLSVAKVESDFNPNARTGSYKGLFQLSNYEFEKYGDGSIWDARDNARAAAHMFLIQAERFKWALGHFPDYAERYMVHQQGIEGAIEHYEHPERVAWQSMCATSEGVLKGERWCKKCIWGNLLPRWKRAYGSVEKISSADFVSLWTGRINLYSDRYSAISEADFANADPAVRVPLPAITTERHSRLHRTTERSLRAVAATSKTAVASNKSAVASSKPAIASNKSAVAGSKPAIASSKPAVTGNKSAVAGNKPAVASTKPTVASNKPAASSDIGSLLSALTQPNRETTRATPSQTIAIAAPERKRGSVISHRAQRQATSALK